MDQTNQERILGIDPGLNITGYGVIESSNGSVVEAGVIRMGNRKPIEDRLRELYDGLTDVIESLHPSAVAIEDLYSHYERPRTAIIMGHARGVILLASQQQGLAVNSYAATKVKSVTTGNGRASKSQMQLAVCRQLNLAEIPEPPDVADALAIALCHRHHCKPHLGQPPQSANQNFQV